MLNQPQTLHFIQGTRSLGSLPLWHTILCAPSPLFAEHFGRKPKSKLGVCSIRLSISPKSTVCLELHLLCRLLCISILPAYLAAWLEKVSNRILGEGLIIDCYLYPARARTSTTSMRLCTAIILHWSSRPICFIRFQLSLLDVSVNCVPQGSKFAILDPLTDNRTSKSCDRRSPYLL